MAEDFERVRRLSTGQIARRWGVSRSTVRRLCASGRKPPKGLAPCHSTPGGQHRVSVAVVEEFERLRGIVPIGG
jgi:transposase